MNNAAVLVARSNLTTLATYMKTLPDSNITEFNMYVKRNTCEYASIPMALIKYPQGNLEEIQQETLLSTQEESRGHQDHKAQAYATERYQASSVR